MFGIDTMGDRLTDSFLLKQLYFTSYTVTDIPPLHITLLLGCQQWLTMIGATVLQPLILIPAMGGSPEQTAKAISTIFVVCGINTLLQTTVGDRLPIVQGGSFSYLPPVFSIIFNSKLQSIQDNNERFEETLATVGGAIFVVGIVQAFIGYTGLVVPMLRFISPVTIAPVIAIIGLSLYHLGFADISSCWSIGLIQIALATIFSQYLKRVMVRLRHTGPNVICMWPRLTRVIHRVLSLSGVWLPNILPVPGFASSVPNLGVCGDFDSRRSL